MRKNILTQEQKAYDENINIVDNVEINIEK